LIEGGPDTGTYIKPHECKYTRLSDLRIIVSEYWEQAKKGLQLSDFKTDTGEIKPVVAAKG
jgi:hypothetical protein